MSPWLRVAKIDEQAFLVGIWGFKATAECLVPLTRAILGVTPPAYEAVLALDRKIRNLTVPNALSDILPTQSVSSGMVTGFQGSSIADRTALSMREFVRSHYQDLSELEELIFLNACFADQNFTFCLTVLLFLHRAHFAQAMTESPVNPLKSPYAHSVTAAYASACGVLRSTRDQAEKNLALCSRVWRIWSFTFSAAVRGFLFSKSLLSGALPAFAICQITKLGATFYRLLRVPSRSVGYT